MAHREVVSVFGVEGRGHTAFPSNAPLTGKRPVLDNPKKLVLMRATMAVATPIAVSPIYDRLNADGRNLVEVWLFEKFKTNAGGVF